MIPSATCCYLQKEMLSVPTKDPIVALTQQNAVECAHKQCNNARLHNTIMDNNMIDYNFIVINVVAIIIKLYNLLAI